MIINIDRKSRSINLSIKAKDNVENAGSNATDVGRTPTPASGTTSLGALLKAKLDNKN